jgi:hypothetical protein
MWIKEGLVEEDKQKSRKTSHEKIQKKKKRKNINGWRVQDIPFFSFYEHPAAAETAIKRDESIPSTVYRHVRFFHAGVLQTSSHSTTLSITSVSAIGHSRPPK